MTPEEIMQAYDVLVQEGNTYAAQEAAKVGNSQRSIGGLAEVVANPSRQTSGLANYTYDRTMRPVVDSLAANLTVQGKTQAMNRYLKDELMKAKSAYEDAKNNYTLASSNPSSGNNNNDDGVNRGGVTSFDGREKKDPTQIEGPGEGYVPTAGDRQMSARYVLKYKRNPKDNDTFTWDGVDYVYKGGRWTTKVY